MLEETELERIGRNSTALGAAWGHDWSYIDRGRLREQLSAILRGGNGGVEFYHDHVTRKGGGKCDPEFRCAICGNEGMRLPAGVEQEGIEMRPDLEAIKARADAATAGPWEVEPDEEWRWLTVDTECDLCQGGVDLLKVVAHSDEEEVTEGHRHWSPSHLITASSGRVAGNYDYEDGGIIRHEDTVFIANAREDIPAMLKYVAELEAELMRARSLLDGQVEND